MDSVQIDPAPGTLAVVFDSGSASAAEISAAAAKLGPMVSVLGPSESAAQARRFLERGGPVVDIREGFDATVERLRTLGASGITTFSEDMLPLTHRLAHALGLDYHDASALLCLTDKDAQRRQLAAAGVSRVRSVLLAGTGDWPEAVDRVRLPAVLKPARGAGSRDTYRIDDADAGAALVAELFERDAGRFVLEELLVGRDEGKLGDYVSVECVTSDGLVQPFMVTGKLPQLPPFREAGQYWPARLCAEERTAIMDLAAHAVEALGVRSGLAHVEIKLTAEGPRIIEVNGRLGGLQNDLAARALGLDLVELGGRVALGQPVTLAPLALDKVYFQYTCPAPTVACRLATVRGIEQARRIPGITAYRAFAMPGAEIPGGVGTNILGVVTGEAPDHDAMLQIMSDALNVLKYGFAMPDGRLVEVRAGETDLVAPARPTSL